MYYINKRGINVPIDHFTMKARTSKAWDCCILCYNETGRYVAKAIGSELSNIKKVWICRDHMGSKGLYRKIAAFWKKREDIKRSNASQVGSKEKL
jgi:hypothetical protein